MTHAGKVSVIFPLCRQTGGRMEDKRIIKTKKNIKSTLIDILQKTPFEKITVAELCRRGTVSRITFYVHYEDKYALIEEMFADYILEASRDYHELQKKNNPAGNGIKGYINLIEAILCLFYDNYAFFSHTTAQENPYLYSVFFNNVFASVDDYLRRHTCLAPRFPIKQTAALLCNGLFGVINISIADRMPEAEARSIARDMYLGILESNLFRRADVCPPAHRQAAHTAGMD